ncbi:INO80 complex, subunit Ies4 [Elaphomyces granulatus]
MPAVTTTPTSSSNGRSTKSDRSNKTVVLRLAPDLLSRFPSNVTSSKSKKNSSKESSSKENPSKENQSKEIASPSSTSADPVAPPSSVDNASDAASTPAAPTPRKKGIPGPKPGNKRSLNQMGEVLPKPRGKPGPKKKPRLEDGIADQSKLMPAPHKLGPKANQGAINAGLRALDRTGAPCRKWQRKPFELKSFTGILWQVPIWRTPRPKKLDLDLDGRDGALETGDSDSKANIDGSIVPSEKSNSGDGELTPLPTSIATSPAPVIAMAA